MTAPTQAQIEDVEIEQLKRQLASWQIVANQGAHIEAQLRKDLLTVECCTIERCAQVAEKDNNYRGKRIAAAIRKLKDEP